MMIALSVIPAQAPGGDETLTLGGAVIMTLSVGLVLGLTVFCFWRILRTPSPADRHHAPLEIDTKDDRA